MHFLGQFLIKLYIFNNFISSLRILYNMFSIIFTPFPNTSQTSPTPIQQILCSFLNLSSPISVAHILLDVGNSTRACWDNQGLHPYGKLILSLPSTTNCKSLPRGGTSCPRLQLSRFGFASGRTGLGHTIIAAVSSFIHLLSKNHCFLTDANHLWLLHSLFPLFNDLWALVGEGCGIDVFRSENSIISYSLQRDQL